MASLALFRRNLAKCGQVITLQNRDITAPNFGSADFDENFTDTDTPTALVKTTRGKTLFDGVGADNPITHEICLLYLPGVTSETWVELADGRRLDIIDVENCGEQNLCLKLRCTERGLGEASKV